MAGSSARTGAPALSDASASRRPRGDNPRRVGIETWDYTASDNLLQPRESATIHYAPGSPDASFAVFDTLRFADRLKDSGFESRQAEGIARALGDEMGEHVVTKSSLNSEISGVRTSIGSLGARIDGLDARVGALDAKLDAKVDALDARIDALDGKLSARIDTLGTHIRFMLATMALLLALGLIDTVPRLLG